MAKQIHSPASETKTPTPNRTAPTRQSASSTGAARRPPARRGSVTKPVKRTPWSAIITGALVLVGIIVIAAVVASQINKGGSTTAANGANNATPAVGAAIPDFTVKSQEGKTLTKADVLGKPTLMVFFASWCPHCQAEAPRIRQIAQANPDLNVVMIGVGDRDTQADIYAFQGKFGLPFPTYADPTTPLGAAAAAWGIQSYPSLFAVDKNGIVRAVNTGEVDPSQLQQMVAKAKA